MNGCQQLLGGLDIVCIPHMRPRPHNKLFRHHSYAQVATKVSHNSHFMWRSGNKNMQLATTKWFGDSLWSLCAPHMCSRTHATLSSMPLVSWCTWVVAIVAISWGAVAETCCWHSLGGMATLCVCHLGDYELMRYWVGCQWYTLVATEVCHSSHFMRIGRGNMQLVTTKWFG